MSTVQTETYVYPPWERNIEFTHSHSKEVNRLLVAWMIGVVDRLVLAMLPSHHPQNFFTVPMDGRAISLFATGSESCPVFGKIS